VVFHGADVTPFLCVLDVVGVGGFGAFVCVVIFHGADVTPFLCVLNVVGVGVFGAFACVVIFHLAVLAPFLGVLVVRIVIRLIILAFSHFEYS